MTPPAPTPPTLRRAASRRSSPFGATPERVRAPSRSGTDDDAPTARSALTSVKNTLKSMRSYFAKSPTTLDRGPPSPSSSIGRGSRLGREDHTRDVEGTYLAMGEIIGLTGFPDDTAAVSADWEVVLPSPVAFDDAVSVLRGRERSQAEHADSQPDQEAASDAVTGRTLSRRARRRRQRAMDRDRDQRREKARSLLMSDTFKTPQHTPVVDPHTQHPAWRVLRGNPRGRTHAAWVGAAPGGQWLGHGWLSDDGGGECGTGVSTVAVLSTSTSSSGGSSDTHPGGAWRVWNHPFSLELGVSSLAGGGWPRLCVALYRTWDREEVPMAYGLASLPLSPGTHLLEVPVWRAGDARQQRNERMACLLHAGDTKLAHAETVWRRRGLVGSSLETHACGTVTVRINVIMKDVDLVLASALQGQRLGGDVPKARGRPAVVGGKKITGGFKMDDEDGEHVSAGLAFVRSGRAARLARARGRGVGDPRDRLAIAASDAAEIDAAAAAAAASTTGPARPTHRRFGSGLGSVDMGGGRSRAGSFVGFEPGDVGTGAGEDRGSEETPPRAMSIADRWRHISARTPPRTSQFRGEELPMLVEGRENE